MTSMDPVRNMSQNDPENPGSSTENARWLEDYIHWDLAGPSLEEPPLPSPRAADWATTFSDWSNVAVGPDYSSHLVDNLPSWDQTGHHRYRMASVPRSDDDVASTSGYSSGHSPPGLIRSGSSSPSDHTGSPVSSHPSSPRQSHLNVRDAHVYDDDWTYSSLHNETDSAKTGANDYGYHQYSHAKHSRRGEEASHLKRRRSGETLEKRHRHLADPSQTADVRKTGACVPCRVTKTKCHDHGVCPKCRQAFPDHSHLACQRMMPSHAYPIMSACPDIWSKHAREEAALGSGAHLFIGTPRTIAIFFSKEGRSSVLPATVQAYQSQRGEDASGLKTVSFPHQCVPDYRTLQAWVEGQMRLEHRVDFEHALQSFLLAYTEEGRGLPKHSFVSRVHEMNCFFKIWKTSKFWCRDPSHKVVALPLSVQAQLRRIAFVAIRSAEIDILKQLDDSLTQQAAMKPQEGMAMWASMWQLILIYRELLHSLRSSVDRYQRASKAEYAHLCDSLHKVSNIFFPLLTTFYHYQFRTKKNVEVSLDWLKASGYQVVREFAQQMLATRKEMLHKLQASKSSVDAHLCVFVVNHELKKLNARKRNPKSSSRSKHAFDDDCDDE